MKAVLKKWLQALRKSPPGFTLVELLVVVGIIVALSAVIIPAVAQFADRGDEGARAAELSSVQAAMDALMADAGITTIDAYNTASDPAISNFTDLPEAGGAAIQAGGVDVDLTNYLRSGPTQFAYCWESSGLVLGPVDIGANCDGSVTP